MRETRRVSIVTGAAGGIGRALVEILVSQGDLVIAVDQPGPGIDDLGRALGSPHVAIGCDLSQKSQIDALFAQIDKGFAGIGALFNNAAVGPTMAPTVETGFENFRMTLDVNLTAPFLLSREAARRMKAGGVIVNTASLAGVLGNPRRNAYAASKAGLISLTKSLACEWASRGIRVNAVAPGYVRTPMVAELERLGKADLAAVRRRVPLGRMGRPDEIAQALCFLASDSARYITGSVLSVDGGWASFNQPGDAHPPVDGIPAAELLPPEIPAGPRSVVVTGAARGIGEATARAFAANGDRVVAVDRDGDRVGQLVDSLGDGHEGLAANVADERQVASLFETIAGKLGKVDILINNAAISDSFRPATEQTAEEFDAVLDVNLAGAFLCAREALRTMQRGGMVVNLGSINTFLPFVPRHAYGASKAAIDILTRCMAAELGPQGIRTATIAPGYIRTPGVASLERNGKIDSGSIRRRIPMGDLGRPQDIADAALFLTSPAASYVTGSILYVDGGWTSFGNAGNASDGESPA